MAALWAWAKGLFTAKKMGILCAIFAEEALAPAMAQIMDPENQKKAYELAKALHLRKDMSCLEKAEAFNLQMLVWAGKAGRIIADSAINCLREMAVSALKAKLAKNVNS